MRSRQVIAVISIAVGTVAAAFAASAHDSVVEAVANSDQWAIAGHDYGNTRFSLLKQIDSENASRALSTCRRAAQRKSFRPRM